MTPAAPTFQTRPYPSTFDEERQEAFACIVDSLASGPADPDRIAVCVRLLEHLSGQIRPLRRPLPRVS